MTTHASVAVADRLLGRTRSASAYLRRLEEQHLAGRLSERDATRAYEGAFLGFYTDLERHLEQLFLGLIMGRYVVTGADIRPLVRIDSEVVARRIVAGGKNKYVDWLPFQHIDDRAPAFLSRGKPFDRLTSADREVLTRMQWIRNAIAHRSGRAMKIFHRQLTDGKGLPPSQRTPAGYLRGEHRLGQTRLEYFMAQGTNAVSRLCS